MFTATAHQFCHPSSGNKLESWVWVQIHGAFSQHFWSQNHARLFPILPFTSLLCLAFTLSRHLKNENSMFIIIHENSLGMEKVSFFFPPTIPFLFLLGKIMLFFSLLNWCFTTEFTGRQPSASALLILISRMDNGEAINPEQSAGCCCPAQLLWYKVTYMLPQPGQLSTVQAASPYRVPEPCGMNRDAVRLLLSQPRLQCCCLRDSVQHISVLDWALLNTTTVNMLISISAPPNYTNWDGTYCSWHNIIDHYLVILLWDREKILFYFKYQ